MAIRSIRLCCSPNCPSVSFFAKTPLVAFNLIYHNSNAKFGVSDRRGRILIDNPHTRNPFFERLFDGRQRGVFSLACRSTCEKSETFRPRSTSTRCRIEVGNASSRRESPPNIGNSSCSRPAPSAKNIRYYNEFDTLRYDLSSHFSRLAPFGTPRLLR